VFKIEILKPEKGFNMFLRHAISTAVKNPCSGLMGYHAMCVVTIVAREHTATAF